METGSSDNRLASNVFDTALIFEGGGMRVSYTCAFANVLLENGIFFDNVYGLSAGASNTVNYVSRDTQRTRASFIDYVTDPKFGGIKTMLQHKGYFSAEYTYQEMGRPGGTLPFDFATFAANPAHVTIEGFERDTGRSVYWTKDDLSTLDDLMVRVRASSTLPFFMPPPKVNGRYFYDGGLGEGAGFLLPRAMCDGFERFVIVRTRPKAYRKSPQTRAQAAAFGALFARRPHVRKALATRTQRYNEQCDEIERLEREGKAWVFYAQRQGVESGTTDLQQLAANYVAGYAQAMHDLPSLKEFLGIN